MARASSPVVIRGETFPSIRAAAEAFGVQDQTIRKAIAAGRLDHVGRGSRAGLAPMPVRVRGRDYPSARAAAKALGLSVSTINKAIDQGRQDVVGLKQRRRRGGNTQPFTFAGVTWPSRRDAARDAGVTYEHLWRGLRRNLSTVQERLIRAAWLRMQREASEASA